MDFIEIILHSKGQDLDILQTAIRTIIVFVLTLMIIRIGKKRFLGKNTSFDVVLGVILGSVLSRTINGSAALFPTLVAGLTLIALHWIISAAAAKWEKLANFIEGIPRQLIKGGQVDYDALKRSHLRLLDVIESLRIHAQTSKMEKVEESYMETNGKISFVLKDKAKD